MRATHRYRRRRDRLYHLLHYDNDMTPTEPTPTKITPKRFSIIIEELVRTKRLTHFEAVMYYCEQNGLEAHTITKWIDKSMREKIQYNAEELNYLPKTSSLF